MTGTIFCEKHGDTKTTYTCKHLLETIQDMRARGFHWTTDNSKDIQAFCDQCWDCSDSEWEELQKAGPRLLCLECLKIIAAVNGTTMDFDGKD